MTTTSSTNNNTNQLPKPLIFLTSGLGGCLGWAMIHPFNTLAVRRNLSNQIQPKTVITSVNTLQQDAMNFRVTNWNMNRMNIKSLLTNTLSLYEGLTAGVSRQVIYASARFGLFESFRDWMHELRGVTDFTSRVCIGALTGGIAAYLSAPLELTVVRMSNDSTLPPHQQRNYTSVTNALLRISKEEGIRTFWRGSSPFVQRAMMVGVFQVATLDQFKHLYAQTMSQTVNSIPNVFCASMTSGFIYSVATMPLEATKNRLTSQRADHNGKLPYTGGTIRTLVKIVKLEGVGSLYRGFSAYCLRCGGHTVCMFVIVQMLRDMIKDKHVGSVQV